MKKILFLLVFFTSLARVAYSQIIDSISSPPYICQAHAFDVKVFGMVSGGNIHPGPQNYQHSNDTIYVNFHFVPGIGPAVPMPFQRQINILAPPIGQYKIKVQSFYDGTPLPAHFTTLSVCAGVAAVPEKDIQAWQPEIFPNPTTGLLYLSRPAGSGPFTATVTDVTGKTWISQKGQPATPLSLDLGALPNGMYLVRVQTGKGMTTRPILKF